MNVAKSCSTSSLGLLPPHQLLKQEEYATKTASTHYPREHVERGIIMWLLARTSWALACVAPNCLRAFVYLHFLSLQYPQLSKRVVIIRTISIIDLFPN